jgi:hypothetical protein
LDVSQSSYGVELRGEDIAFSLSADGDITVEPITRWIAYGRGQPATAIQIISKKALPWTGIILLEVL